jgi:hypothetical protein
MQATIPGRFTFQATLKPPIVPSRSSLKVSVLAMTFPAVLSLLTARLTTIPSYPSL